MSRKPVSNNQRNEVFGLLEKDKLSKSDISGSQELRDVFRDLSKRSLYFLCKAVLGYTRLTKQTHWELCAFTQDLNIKRQLALMPRGTYKTTVRTKGFAVWIILNNPDIRILLANQTARNANIMLQEIEQQLDGSNEMMNWLFPEFIKPNDKHKPWSNEMMMVPNRAIISGTPTIMTVGTGGRIESQHFDIIITDDLIGEKAMESEKEMMDAVLWHDGIESLFITPDTGIERMSGTRWSLSDLYSVIIDDPEYAIYHKKAEDPKTGELYFPELLPKKTLEKIRARNFALYMSQYMNDPENPSVLEFRREWLNNYSLVKTDAGPACECDGRNFLLSDMDGIIAVDPAASGDIDTNIVEQMKRGRAKKSNNAVMFWALHGSGRYFLIDSVGWSWGW